MTSFPKKTILFAAPNDEQSIRDAKAYIKFMKFDSTQVKLIKKSGQILVEALKDID